jgi:hypothetical protein
MSALATKAGLGTMAVTKRWSVQACQDTLADHVAVRPAKHLALE